MSITIVWADAYDVGTAAELKFAIECLTDDNQTINLTATVTLTENINATHSFTLNLGCYSITNGNYSISLDDGVTVTTSKAGAYFSTTHNGWEIFRQKISTGGYKYLPAAPVAKQSYSLLYYASLEDAIDDYNNGIDLQSNATMTRNVTRNATSKSSTLTINLGDYTISNGSYKIYLHKDVQAKLDKTIDSSVFALCNGESGSLYTYEGAGINKYCYVFGNEKEAKIGETEYGSFTDAVVNAQKNDVITLLRHVALANYTMTSPTKTFKVKKDGYSITVVGYEGYEAKYSTDNDGITTYTQAPASIVYTALNNSTPTYYEKLGNALQSGTYKLLQDITVTTRIPTAKYGDDVTVDLNGHTITNTKATDSEEYCFGLTRTNQKLTIKDSSEGKTGKVVANNCIFVNSSGNELNIEAAIEVTGDFAVATNGSTTTSGTINIKEGAKLTSTVTALYLPGVVNATISGQRVSTLKKGLYIVNGKKVIMK